MWINFFSNPNSDVSSKNEGGSDQANHSSSDEDEDGDNTVEEFPPLERAAQSPLAGQNGEDTKMDVDSENSEISSIFVH